MKGKFSFVMGTILVLGVGAALYIAPPLLQTPEARIAEQADVYAERARRILDQYNQGHTDVENLMEVLRRKLADVDLTAENVVTLISYEPRTPLGEQFKSQMQAQFGEQGQPGQITQAIQSARQAIDQNGQLLEQAWQEIDTGATLRDGAASTIKHSYINSIGAMIRYHQADALSQRALLKRVEADLQLNHLRRLFTDAKNLEGNAPTYDQGAVDKRIAAIKTTIEEKQKQIEEETKNLKNLEAGIEATEKALAESRQTADRARFDMETIQEKGYDVADPASYEAFAKAYAEVALRYRQANLNTARIEFGTIENAVIDETGDLIAGKYVAKDGNDMKFHDGIDPQKTKMADVQLTIASHHDTIAALNEVIAQLQELKTNLAAKQKADEDLRQTLTDRIKAVAEEIRRLLAEAATEEDEALNRLEGAALRFKQVSTNAREEFPTNQSVGAEALARRGDAAYLRGQIYYQRIRQTRQVKNLFTQIKELGQNVRQVKQVTDLFPKAKDFGITEFDPADADKQIEEATTAAMESLREAMQIYQDNMGSLGSHFSVVGNIAAVRFLMGQITTHEKSRKTFHDQGIQLLTSIAKGRVDNPHVKDYVTALERMGVDVAVLTQKPPAEGAPATEGAPPADEAAPAESDAPVEAPDPAETPATDDPSEETEAPTEDETPAEPEVAPADTPADQPAAEEAAAPQL